MEFFRKIGHMELRIQDFSEGGAPTLGGVPTYYLPNFSGKLHENEGILAERGASRVPGAPPPPLDSPLTCQRTTTSEKL